ncbi:RluA family pseudouridine synthase [Mycoplasmopsis columbinasalis]|uniref:Pseudouridine synthase n=1 Tax=Mycoplasmopsis columbinasalis TaxID=114880 RepID=A0A449BBC4_9BACT|nr:RluA family pseudouridine synthase [Mycoplasmopsis columbinasalis]VEU78342.1 pseudouridylate synthase [Mycoplasmopsis columbinasalis]
MIRITVNYNERLDKYLANNSEISRNDAKELILQGAVKVNNNVVTKQNFPVKENDVIEVAYLLEKTTTVEPVAMQLDILYEDDDLVVINKPSNLVVHPAPGHFNDTLVNGLIHHFKQLSDANGEFRPGIVHRIDKDTSGLLLVAKTNEIHNALGQMLKQHKINRSYIAIVEGLIPHKLMKINIPLARSRQDRKLIGVDGDGKNAITYVEVLKTFYFENHPYTLIRCELETGRTHQIRVHLAHIKHPIYGDATYGSKVDDFNQRLHAYKLEFIHPKTQQKIELFAQVPPEFDIAEYDFNELKSLEPIQRSS